jgi:AcrR family transcriptional regulator
VNYLNDNTKNKIIKKSIELFNIHGYENVSMRDIAVALNISPGNLTYHFKKKNDILFEILQLLAKEHAIMHYTTEISLQEFNSILIAVSNHQRKYVFYYRNIIELQKKYSWIAKVQIDYKKEFIVLIKGILKHFAAKGWLQVEDMECLYENLSYAILSITTFWTQFNVDKDMTLIIWSILLPNLTEKGRLEYQNFSSAYKSDTI